jgi:drug/metabolite transporter (DMT)-like permease
MSWLQYSLVAMVALVPLLVSTGVAAKHFGIKADVIPIYYGLGVTIGILFWILSKSRGSELIIAKPHLFFVVLGMTCGVAVNICFFKALAIAPNPGLPPAVINGSSALAFFIVVPLAAFAPKIFQQAQISWRHALGLGLVLIGTSLFSFK